MNRSGTMHPEPQRFFRNIRFAWFCEEPSSGNGYKWNLLGFPWFSPRTPKCSLELFIVINYM
jgi:hypothetical protein